ncbi:hypothetical protein [Polynucleobacter sp. AM-25C3]|uniref:hypothetical protein n=1 Tax=Polynucleobacter sp. AM-25C3 TaxID=1855569 RepID=UPI001C0C0FD3|nr:hypothetical protein [Polynucleobacter sp. AM-25C3]MBU3601194.1 hypothetical protein [Polynucleobacter sp. AM-25C3]
MKKHLKNGVIAFLIIYVLMMIWASLGMLFDYEVPNSPIAFTLQRHWLLAWTIISLVFSFMVMVLVAISSLLLAMLKRASS